MDLRREGTLLELLFVFELLLLFKLSVTSVTVKVEYGDARCHCPLFLKRLFSLLVKSCLLDKFAITLL